MLPSPIKNIIDHLSRLPGIGQRSATRLAFWFINQPQKDLEELSLAIKNLKSSTKVCPQCFNLTNDTLCQICANPKRDKKIICVVEDILDILPIEGTHQYQGVYHILGGLISPPQGVSPEKLKIKELIQRIKQLQEKNTTALPAQARKAQNLPSGDAKKQSMIEIILALNPTTEGDTTTLYLERQLRPLGIKITRLGRGLSSGSDLEYTDEATLISALRGRK